MKFLVAVLMLVGLVGCSKPEAKKDECWTDGKGATKTCLPKPSSVDLTSDLTNVGDTIFYDGTLLKNGVKSKIRFVRPDDSYNFTLPADWSSVDCRKRTRRQVRATIVLTASVPNEVTNHPICMVPKALLPKESK